MISIEYEFSAYIKMTNPHLYLFIYVRGIDFNISYARFIYYYYNYV